jgi:hypothetical protein
MKWNGHVIWNGIQTCGMKWQILSISAAVCQSSEGIWQNLPDYSIKSVKICHNDMDCQIFPGHGIWNVKIFRAWDFAFRLHRAILMWAISRPPHIVQCCLEVHSKISAGIFTDRFRRWHPLRFSFRGTFPLFYRPSGGSTGRRGSVASGALVRLTPHLPTFAVFRSSFQ